MLRPHDYSADGFNDWAFMTTHSWDEDPAGEWVLEIENTSEANNYGNAGPLFSLFVWWYMKIIMNSRALPHLAWGIPCFLSCSWFSFSHPSTSPPLWESKCSLEYFACLISVRTASSCVRSSPSPAAV